MRAAAIAVVMGALAVEPCTYEERAPNLPAVAAWDAPCADVATRLINAAEFACPNKAHQMRTEIITYSGGAVLVVCECRRAP